MITARPSFYITGGTLPRDAPSYIERQADEDLLNGLRHGQFCYVLTSRQMGKSSLMIRTAACLRDEGVAVAILDLTAVGQNLTPEQWFDGLLNLLGSALDLEDELEEFWFAHERLSPLQRWMEGLHQIVLRKTQGPVVLFVDEIDAVRSLPFSADEFFAAIRECYNRRTEDPDFRRLTFCLLGVASPSDLIRETRNTPFNIGRRIELTDFTPEEAATLAVGLQAKDEGGRERADEVRVSRTRMKDEGKGIAHPSSFILHPLPGSFILLKRVLYWTGGQPYLTQRLCQAVADELATYDANATPLPPRMRGEAAFRPARMRGEAVFRTPRMRGAGGSGTDIVDRQCARLFLSVGARERDDNLIFVRERLLRSTTDVAGLLELYRRTLRGQRAPDDEAQPLVSVLKLSGIVRAEAGGLTVRNRIYRHVFDRVWITDNMPDAEQRRQRAAFWSGGLRATLLTVILVGLLAALLAARDTSRRALKDAAAARQIAALRESRRLSAEKALWETARASDLAQQDAEQAKQAAKRERALRRQAEEAELTAKQAELTAKRERARALRQQRIAQQHADDANHQRQIVVRLQRFIEQQAIGQQAYLDRAHALRISGQPGDRLDALDAVAKAAKLHPSPEIRLQLRNEAIADMALPVDLRVQRQWTGQPDSRVVAIDPDHNRYFRADASGTLSVLRLTDDRLTATLPGFGSPEQSIQRHSPDGRYLACMYHGDTIILWDCRAGRALARYLPRAGGTRNGPIIERSLDFSPDSRRVALGYSDRSVRILTLPDLREIGRFSLTGMPGCLRFSLDGRYLAAAANLAKDVHVLDLKDGSDTAISTPAGTSEIAWQPGGQRLAVGCRDHHIYLLDVEARRIARDLQGSLNIVTQVSFNPDGTLLASSGWDGVLRLWSPQTGKQLLSAPVSASDALRFSSDGSRLTGVAQTESWLWEVEKSGESHVLGELRSGWVSVPEFSPDGQMLVASDRDGAHLWNVANSRLLASLDLHGCLGALFRPDGSELLTGVSGLVQRWPLTRNGASASLQVGPPGELLSIAPPGGDGNLCQSADGRVIAMIHPQHGAVVAFTEMKGPVVLKSQHRMMFIAISTDTRWVATSPWQTPGQVEIWEAHSGRLVRTLPISDSSQLAFSPDGRWLVTGAGEYCFWEVGTWRPGRRLSRAPGSVSPGALDFSRDGRMLAMAATSTLVRLVDPVTGREFASLEAGDEPISRIRFSPNGALLGISGKDGMIRIWDLREIRRNLATLGLDWDQPPYPPLQNTPDSAPLSIKVLGAGAHSQ